MVACGLIVYGVATTDGEAEAIGMTGSMGFAGNETLASKPLLENAEQSVTANSTNPVSPFGTPIDRKCSTPEVSDGF